MAIVKLICQGCGANLDTTDDRRVMQCGYCGTTNQIKQTVQPQPTPQPPPARQVAPIQISVPTPQQQRGARRGILFFVLIMALLPILLGGFITYMVTSRTSEIFDEVGGHFGLGSSNDDSSNAAASGAAGARRYQWVSARPFLADVNGDGSEDILGIIQEAGGQKLLLTAMSGSDYASLWEVELGRRADLPNAALRFDPEAELLLFQLGPTVHAHDAASGAERWVASLPDKVETLAREGDHLWVQTIDDAGHAVSLADGSVSEADKQPADDARPLRDASGYELIPNLRTLDLKSKQFDDLRVEQGYCPKHALALESERRRRNIRCAHPHGLAFATRAKGTKVPFMVGYERDSKDERWRVQLTKAGSLATVESGFAQPRAEILGDEALISFTPSSTDEVHVRRISLADGETRWETTLEAKPHDNLVGMVAGKKRAFVGLGHAMQVLDLQSGEVVAQLGGLF